MCSNCHAPRSRLAATKQTASLTHPQLLLWALPPGCHPPRRHTPSSHAASNRLTLYIAHRLPCCTACRFGAAARSGQTTSSTNSLSPRTSMMGSPSFQVRKLGMTKVLSMIMVPLAARAWHGDVQAPTYTLRLGRVRGRLLRAHPPVHPDAA